nr:fimbria/pilus outer membrane usher protein [uncultured Moellerella sp.]
MKKIKKYLLSFTAIMVSLNCHAIEFNIEHLNIKDKSNVDLSMFSKSDYIQPGDYYLRIKLNNNIKSEKELIKYIENNDGTSYPCITDKVINEFGIKSEYLNRLAVFKNNSCYNFSAEKEIIVTFDKYLHQLDIIIPQSWLLSADPTWVHYSQWDNGVSGVFFDYNWYFNYLKSKSADEAYKINNYGTLGTNLSAWRFRADYQFNYNKQGDIDSYRLEFPQKYAYRAIPEIKSKFVTGDMYLKSELSDAFRFTGLSLFTDERMLPPSARGYAPQIEGIARTNATVTLEKSGAIIKRIQVPPGSFSIDNLPANINGNIKVTVEEEDGSTDIREIYVSPIATMLRPGNLSYSVSAGKTNLLNKSFEKDLYFINSELFLGLTNQTTLYSGILSSNNVQSYDHLSLGINQSLYRLGALSFDATHLKTEINNHDDHSGNRFRLSYSNRIERTNTDLFANSQISDKDYISIPHYLSKINGANYGDREKRTDSVSVRQYINPLAISLALTAARTHYWERGEQVRYSLFLNKNFDLGQIKGITSSLNFSHTHGAKNNQEEVYLSLSFPLNSKGRVNYNQRYSIDKNTHSNNISYSDQISDRSNYGLSVSNTKLGQESIDPAVSAFVNYNSAYGDVYVNAAQQRQQYRSLNTSWNGGLTVTGHGLAFHRAPSGNHPRIMIDANGIKDIPINNYETITNKKGIGVLTNVNNFSPSEFNIDISNLPKNVSVMDTVFSKTLTEGAIGYYKLNSVSGENILAIIKLNSGNVAPLGTAVIDANSGREIGIVGGEGQAYLTGVDRKKEYIINLNSNDKCKLHFEENKTSTIYCQ